LVRRLRSRGGTVACGAPVDRLVIERGRATGVEVAGTRIAARRAVVAAVDAEVLYHRLVGADRLPPSFVAGLRTFQRGWATVKVDWALAGPVPWADPEVAGAGTVHLAASVDELAVSSVEVAGARLPTDPFVVLGQMTTTDPTRSPAGTESAWAYTHVPGEVAHHTGRRPLDTRDVDEVARRIEERVERYAPGFGARIVARHVM